MAGMPEGTYSLSAQAAGCQTDYQGTDVTVEADKSASAGTFIVTDRTSGIKGTVTDAAGNPVAGATVILRSNGSATNVVRKNVQTGSDGSFLFADIEAGTYVLSASQGKWDASLNAIQQNVEVTASAKAEAALEIPSAIDIVNGGFEDVNLNGWSSTGSSGRASNDSGHGHVHTGKWGYTSWKTSAFTVALEQTVSDLENGSYVVHVSAAAAAFTDEDADNIYLYAKNAQGEIIAKENIPVTPSGSWELIGLKTKVSDRTLTFGISAQMPAGASLNLDDFRVGRLAGGKEPEADKTQLNQLITEIQQSDMSGYTTDSVSEYQNAINSALTAAIEASESNMVTQAEVDQAVSALRAAYEKAVTKLVQKPVEADKSKLSAKIEEIKTISAEGYTEASYQELQTALADAEAVLAEEGATQEAVDTALANLQNAVEGLVRITVDKTKLKTWIDKMEAVLGSGQEFTAVTRKAAEDALKAAKEIYDNNDAGIADVDAAWIDLLNSFLNLDNGAERAGLAQAIETAQGLLEDPKTEEIYTAESVQGVKDALAAAKEIYTKEYAEDVSIEDIQNEISTAENMLIDAVIHLLEKDYGYLSDLIKQAEEILTKEDKYTPASIQKLREALEAAKTVVNDKTAETPVIDEAYDKLLAAIGELQLRGNKGELASVLKKAEEILGQSGKYHPATLEGLKEAYEDAKAVYEDANAVQNQITEAVVRLIKECMEVRVLGDVDMNGTIDTADSALILQHGADHVRLTEEQVMVGDVNGDGRTDKADAARVLELAAEKIETF